MCAYTVFSYIPPLYGAIVIIWICCWIISSLTRAVKNSRQVLEPVIEGIVVILCINRATAEWRSIIVMHLRLKLNLLHRKKYFEKHRIPLQRRENDRFTTECNVTTLNVSYWLWKLCRLTQGQGLTASLGKKPILLVAGIFPWNGKWLLIALYMSESKCNSISLFFFLLSPVPHSLQ